MERTKPSFLAAVLIFCAILCHQQSAQAAFASFRDKSFGKWPKPDNIQWMFDSEFPQDGRSAVSKAFDAVSQQIGGGSCIKYVRLEKEPTDGSPVLVVTNRRQPNYRSGLKPKVCDSMPGRWKPGNESKNYMSIVTATETGSFPCIDNSRVIKGLIYRTLGFWSEFQRPDRDTAVDFDETKLALPKMDTVVYDRKEDKVQGDIVPPNQVDVDSITVPNSLYLAKDPSSAANGAVWTAKADGSGPSTGNGNNEVLSHIDCVVAVQLYKRENPKCNFSACPPAS